MSVVGITMVRDEADIIEHTIRHMAGQVDKLIVANNLSEDGTHDILLMLADELGIVVVDDPDPRYLQSKKMTGLATRAAAMGADWICPFDADELWFAPDNQRFADWLNSRSSRVVHGQMYNYISTALDPDHDDPFVRMQWRRSTPSLSGNVAFRWHPDAVIDAGNHGVRINGISQQAGGPKFTVRHYPRRTPEQMIHSVRNGYDSHKAAGLSRGIGMHYWIWGELLESEGEQAIVDLFYKDHYSADPHADDGLVHDPAPGVA